MAPPDQRALTAHPAAHRGRRDRKGPKAMMDLRDPTVRKVRKGRMVPLAAPKVRRDRTGPRARKAMTARRARKATMAPKVRLEPSRPTATAPSI